MSIEDRIPTPETNPERQSLRRHLGKLAVGAVGGVAGVLVLHRFGIDMGPAVDTALIGGAVATANTAPPRPPQTPEV